MSDVVNESECLITVSQAAKILGVCERTVWKLRKEGQLRGVKIGAAVRYARSELDRFIEDQMNQGSATSTDQ